MSLKAVELQIAIPKTFDAGKIADQHHQNTINQQLFANEALKKELNRQQKIVNETDALNALSEDEESGSDAHHHASSKENKNKKQNQKAHHPFKGNLFDYSG